MSAVRVKQFPLSLPGARQLMKACAGQIDAIHARLRCCFAGHRGHNEQKNHLQKRRDQQC